MTIPSLSSATNVYQPGAPQYTLRKDLNALKSALGSGNLSNAQAAFSTLEKDNPNFVRRMEAGNGAGQNNTVSSAFQSLQNALQSGDLNGAQSAFSSFTQALSGAQKGHHHRVDRDHDGDAGKENTAADSASEAPTTGASLPTGLVNALA